MQKQSRLVVQLDTKLKDDIERQAKAWGLDLTNMVRLLFVNVRDGIIVPTFTTRAVTSNGFTDVAEARIINSLESGFSRDRKGKVREAKSVDQLIEQLEESEKN